MIPFRRNTPLENAKMEYQQGFVIRCLLIGVMATFAGCKTAPSPGPEALEHGEPQTAAVKGAPPRSAAG